MFTKLGAGTVSQVRSLTPNFTVVAVKMWAYRRQNRKKMVIFGINMPQTGILLSAIFFYKIWHANGTPRSAPSCHLTIVIF